MYDYEDFAGYYEGELREDWEQHIHKVITNVVNNKCEDINNRNQELEKRLDEKNKEISDLVKEVKQYKNNISQYTKIESLTKSIDKDNIVSVINSLNFKVANPDNYVDGMDSENISPYLRLIIKYYDNKDIVIEFLEAAGVEDINNLKSFVLPRDYGKDMIKDIIINHDRRTIKTNGCYFNGNFGFWLRGRFKGLSIDNLCKEVPLQEVFKNPHISELFDDILEILKSKYNKVMFGVTRYHKFSDEKILAMAKLLSDNPKNFHSEEKEFISRHGDLLFNNREFCDRYFDYASDNNYSIVAIHKFPKDYQVKFLKGISFNDAMYIINNLKQNEEYKKELIISISKSE